MLLCSIKVSQLGKAGRTAEERDEANDWQFTKVVTRIVSARIGDGVESA